jgi:hypothetical protein
MNRKKSFTAELWTPALRRAVVAYGVVGTVLTLLVAVVFLDVSALEGAFERGGMPPDQAHRAATAGRIGGIVSNVLLVALYMAVGIAGARGQRWAFWTALVIYGFTGAGVVIVPLRDTGLSTAGLVWTLINDGLALVLFTWMMVALIRHLGRRRRSSHDDTAAEDGVQNP